MSLLKMREKNAEEPQFDRNVIRNFKQQNCCTILHMAASETSYIMTIRTKFKVSPAREHSTE